MPLDEKQLLTIREQRKSFNDFLEQNRALRDSRTLHSFSVAQDFLIAILTISLGLGAAIVPLVLLGESLSIEDKIFLTIASCILILNSIFITLVLKKRTEKLSSVASLVGLDENLLGLRLRNLLTKAILTEDAEYFNQYNRQGRKISVESADILGSSSKLEKLDYSSDIASGMLTAGALTALRPIIALNTMWYVIVLVAVSVLMLWWFRRENEMHSKAVKSRAATREKINVENREFNDFVAKLIEKRKSKS